MGDKNPDKFIDRTYLREEQYKDASHLAARIALHEHFSVNRGNYHRWLFDLLGSSPQSRLLELGCGPATLWTNNLDRIPPDWNITLTDISPGMLEAARLSLSSTEHRFAYAVADAQALPFSGNAFDAVIANHMIYHLPDRSGAFSEIKRVLAQGGRFYAATNGCAHMLELGDLAHAFSPDAPLLGASFSNGFTLENGREQIEPYLADVTLHRYVDALSVTSTAPLVAYVRSSSIGSYFDEEGFTRFIEQQIRERGAIHITKDAWLFIADRL